MNHPATLAKRDIILAIVTILVWPFVAGLVLSFVGLFWIIGGASSSPGIIGWSALIVSSIILFLIAISPAILLWRTTKRWSPVLIYIIVFILYFLGARALLTYQQAPHFTESDLLKGEVESQFQKSIYGKWETVYNNKPLIIEFSGGEADSPNDFMRGGDHGDVSFYIPGQTSPLDTSRFWLNGSSERRVLTLRSDVPLVGYTSSDQLFSLYGEISLVSPNKMEFLAKVDDNSPVQSMELVRVQ